jgi:hypothetical protein
MPSRKVTPPTFEELITRIWARGDAGVKPRFGTDPDNGLLIYEHEPVTHYDFVWIKRGLCAKLLLYQGCPAGVVTYGAVSVSDMKKIGEINFLWSVKKQKFEE